MDRLNDSSKSNLLSATEVAKASARQAVVRFVLPLALAAIVVGHFIFVVSIRHQTKMRFEAVRAQVKNAVSNGDLLQIRRLISSLNADRNYREVRVENSDGESLGSWSELDNPYLLTGARPDPVFAFYHPLTIVTDREQVASARGLVHVVFEREFPFAIYGIFVSVIFLLIVCFWLLLQSSLLMLARKLTSPVVTFAANLEDAFSAADPHSAIQALQIVGYSEFLSALERFKILNSRIQSLEVEARQNEKAQALSQIAAQVTHDIRSPLSAINIVAKSLTEIPAEKRLLIQNAVTRINAIANQLLVKYKSDFVQPMIQARTDLKLEKKSITEVLGRVAAEKQLTLSSEARLVFSADISDPVEAICLIDETELSRVLSNLINNSVEALDKVPDAKVTLALRPSGRDEVSVVVYDNGKGIPEEVLAKLGRERVTCGKEDSESGSGIGVFHAVQTVEAMNGKFKIQSKIGVGTIMTLTFPRVDQSAFCG